VFVSPSPTRTGNTDFEPVQKHVFRGNDVSFEELRLLGCYALRSSNYAVTITEKLGYYNRLEVFTAVTMKNVVFWHVAPRGSCKNRHFGGP
jgi:hypothetical protein